jgi:2-haloacid dehalogenase
MNIDTIIFDLGGVLIDWNPAYLFDKLIDDEEKSQYFFQHICTGAWNEEQDGGRSLQKATQLLVDQFPEWQEYIEAYYGRWDEMVGGPFLENVDFFRQLKESGRY